MKRYLVIYRRKSTAALDQPLLVRHVHYLKQMKAERSLVMCGPYANDMGAMLILQGKSLDHVEQLVQSDPFIQEAYYGDYEIIEFYPANASNYYLMQPGEA